ncbi:MAG: bifunctional lysylphosphatidylglycerol flippase/synthetase MprF [Alphaproteobacteria bacterium]
MTAAAEELPMAAAPRVETRKRSGTVSHALALIKDYAPSAIGVALFLLAAWVLHRTFRHITYAELSDEIDALAGWRVLAAIGFTALSFAALAGYEICALRFVGKPLSMAKASLVAFIAQSIAHSTGFAAFVGGGLRYRIYAAEGLDLADVARVQLFFSSTFTLGVMVLSGLALVLEPKMAAAAVALPLVVWQGIGAALLAAVLAYLLLTASGRFDGLRIGRHQVSLPAPGLTALQILLAAVDLGAAGAALYVLLPDLGISMPAFIGLFTAAIIVGVLSHVPGALGVLESLLLLMLQPAPRALPAVIGGLVMFRAVYYLLPLMLGALTLGALEWRHSSGPLRRIIGVGWRTVSPLAPRLYAILAFVAGMVLLFSGALPAEQDRLDVLGDLLPDPLIELSHFAGGLIGVALLLLARSLDQRVREAWFAAVWLIAAGAFVSLLKGFDYEEAIFLGVLLAALIPSRDEFYRTSSLLNERLTWGWTLAIGSTLLATFWLILFAYRHVEYSHELWWQFELEGNAPRALRAMLGGCVVLATFGLTRLLRPAARRPGLPSARDIDEAEAIAARGTSNTDWLATTGDKALLFNPARDAFVMYGAIGRTWVAMAQPVGPVAAWPELIWRFHDEANRHGARTVFYEVQGRALPQVLALGLATMKLGESARVDLGDFNLEGRHRANLRHGHNRAKKEGAVFEVLPPALVPAVIDQLKAVSDAWLAEHDTREKRFSLGFFDPAYVARTPVAVVRRDGGIKAFANLWLAGDKSSCSPDLMRFAADAPKSAMDFLMVEAMLWAKAEGYRQFDLGMAPLAGLPGHRLAPLWSKFARLVYRHGGGLYNFEGLRAFKDKFDPVWEPVYLLYPRGTLARVLTDITALIAGGWAGVVRK